MEEFNPEEYLKNNKPISLIMEEKKVYITDMELQKINKKAYMDATYQFLKTAYMRQHVVNFTENGVLPMIPNDPQLLKLLNDQADNISQKPTNMLITINPRQEVNLDMLKKVVAKVLKKKTITHYAYCYEVRNGIEGLHCHMLVKYADKPYNFKRGIKNTCKDICDIENPHILNFKFVNDDELLQKLEYIKGSKKDSKLSGVVDSVAYRRSNNLEDIYQSTPNLPCRGAENVSLENPISID